MPPAKTILSQDGKGNYKRDLGWTTEGKQVTVDTVASYSRDGLVKGRALAEHLVEEAGATGGRVARRFERLRKFLPRKRT